MSCRNGYADSPNGTDSAFCIDRSGYSERNGSSGLRQLWKAMQYRTASVARERETATRIRRPERPPEPVSRETCNVRLPRGSMLITEPGILSSAWLGRMKNRSSSSRHAASGSRHFSRGPATVLILRATTDFPSCTPRERDHEETYQSTAS